MAVVGTGSGGSFALHRIYDDSAVEGRRILVDRLWPRGVRKVDAALDEWLKDAAPSTELRRWYDHQPSRFEEFAARYRAELGDGSGRAAVEHLLESRRASHVVLLTATRELEHSGARVLFDHLLALDEG